MFEFETEQGLGVSFQRFPYPASGLVTELPRSCGALPIVIERTGSLIIPSIPQEAFWIGLLADARMKPAAVRLHAEVGLYDRRGDQPVNAEIYPALDVVTQVPPHRFIMGIQKSDTEFWPLARVAPDAAPVCQALSLRVFAHRRGARENDAPPPETALRIEFLDIALFEARTGLMVEPLDTSQSYGGWRLP